MAKTINYLSFNSSNAPELLEKLNRVADAERRPVHQLAKLILDEELDRRLARIGGDPEIKQPASGAG